jgi:hypothetical protein
MDTVKPDGVGDDDDLNKIPSLTFEEITASIEGHEMEKKKLWKNRNIKNRTKPDEGILNFGLKSLTNKRIYTVLIDRTNARTKQFHVHYPDLVNGKPFEWISADSGRFVDVKYANKYYPPMLDIDLRENIRPEDHSITITNPGFNPHSSSNRTYWQNDMETEPGSPGFEARMAQAKTASLNYQHFAASNMYPDEHREGNPGPQSDDQRKNVRFSDETSVVTNPNNPNPDYSFSGMSYEDRIQAAIALSKNVESSGGAAEAAPVPAITPTKRDLESLEFDMIIDEVGVATPPIMLPPTYEDAKSNPDYEVMDVSMENREEWLTRLKRSNVISEDDHKKADIVLQ